MSKTMFFFSVQLCVEPWTVLRQADLQMYLFLGGKGMYLCFYVKIIVPDPTVVRDDQAFWPWFFVVNVCSAIAVLISLRQANKAIIVALTKKTAYACKNLHLVQVNTIRMLSSLIKYDAALVMVVCDPRHLSFVAWWIWYLSFLFQGLLALIPLSV
jgi:hypothetical protein